MVYGALPALLNAVEESQRHGDKDREASWVVEMKPEEREFDEVLMTLFGDATGGGSEARSREAVGLLERIIRSSGRVCFALRLHCWVDTHVDCLFGLAPEPFVTASSYETLFQLLVGSFTQQSASLLVVDTVPSESSDISSDDHESDSLPSPISSSLNQLKTLLRLVTFALKVRLDLWDQNPGLFVEAFVVGYLLPKCFDELKGSKVETMAKNIWVAWARVNGSEGKVLDELKVRLADALGEVTVRVRYGSYYFFTSFLDDPDLAFSPGDILRVVSDDTPGIPSSLLGDILPTTYRLDSKLSSLRSTPAHPILSITQSLIPPTSAFPSSTPRSSAASFDSKGFSSYARLVSALLHTFTSDLYKAKSNTWALKHFIALAAYAEESLQLPTIEGEVFRTGLDKEVLEGLRERAKMMQAYLLVPPSDMAGGSWHARVVKAAMPIAEGKGRVIKSQDGIEELLLSLLEEGREEDTYRISRVLFEVLNHVLVDASKDEAEQWMTLARRLERTGMSHLSSVCPIFGH